VDPRPHCARVEGEVSRGAEPERGLVEISGWSNIVRPVIALIHLKDGFHLSPQWAYAPSSLF